MGEEGEDKWGKRARERRGEEVRGQDQDEGVDGAGPRCQNCDRTTFCLESNIFIK